MNTPWPTLESHIEARMAKSEKRPSRLKNAAIATLCAFILVFTGLGILLFLICIGPIALVFWIFERSGEDER